MARPGPHPIRPSRRRARLAGALAWGLLLPSGCTDGPGAVGPDAGTPPRLERGPGLPGELRLELRLRERYPLGAEAWVELRLDAPPGAAGARLRTRALVAVVDGRELPERPWSMDWPLGRVEPIRLELGTLAGAALDGEGAHTLALRLQAELSSGGRGELLSPAVRFVRVAMRPDELVRPAPAPEPDPAGCLEIRLHLGGRSLPVWPAAPQARELLLTARPDRASLWISTRAPCPVDLAFEVWAGPTRLGHLAVEGGRLGAAPVAAAELDLAGLTVCGEELALALRLVPSAREASRHPGVTRFWDRTLDLTPVLLRLPAAPAPGGRGIP